MIILVNWPFIIKKIGQGGDIYNTFNCTDKKIKI